MVSLYKIHLPRLRPYATLIACQSYWSDNLYAEGLYKMNNTPLTTRVRAIVLCVLPLSAAIAHAQVEPERSSIESTTRIELTGTELVEMLTETDEQATTLGELGPVVSTSTIDNAPGEFLTATVTGSASFESSDTGACRLDASYQGSEAQFSWALNGQLQYDFSIPGDGVLTVMGSFFNTGSGVNLFGSSVEVYTETESGAGFSAQPFYSKGFSNLFETVDYDIDVPLDESTGSVTGRYRMVVRMGISSTGGTSPSLRSAGLKASWIIEAGDACAADLTNDGLLDFFDVSAFLDAFGAQDPVADFDDNQIYDFFDVSAFLDAFGGGCP